MPEQAKGCDEKSLRSEILTGALAAILGLATLALYWPVIHNDFINYDDDLYVSANLHVQSGITWENIKWAFGNPVVANWHPLTMLSHMLDCQLYGLHPWGHHLTNILLHALNAVLLFLLLQKMTKTIWRSALVAVLFACHPLHVESVAWVAERKDVLSTCFGILSLMFYLRYGKWRETESEQNKIEQKRLGFIFPSSHFYWLSCLCFTLGLMCKPMLVTWPFVLLLIDYWPLGDFKAGRRWRLVMEKTSFLALAVAMSTVTFLVQKKSDTMSSLEVALLGTRFENVLISYCRYLGKLFWPTNMAVIYPLPDRWPLNLALLAGLLLAGLTTMLWIKRQRYPFMLMGWLWFIGTLVPVIGLVQVGQQAIADRYTYIPSVGLLILIVWGAYELSRHWRWQGITLLVGGLSAVIACSILTRQQISYWKNSEILFRHALDVTRNNYIAHLNLGNAFLEATQTNAAAIQFQEALRLNLNLVAAHAGYGQSLIQRGEMQAAIGQFHEGLRLNPYSAEIHNDLGNALAINGQTTEAVGQFQEAIHLKPDFADAYFNFGNLLAATGQTNEAISEFQEALRYKPNDAEIHNKIGNLLALTGQTNEAIKQFQTAVKLNSNYADAHSNLGNMFSKQGNVDEAIGEFQEVLRLSPDDVEIHYKLGNLFAKKGQTDEAINQFQATLHLKPDFAEAHSNLGTMLTKKGQTDEAINQFQAALRLKPDYAEASYNLGIAFLKKGRLDEAVNQLKTALHGLSDYAPIHLYLGIALAEQGQNDEAAGQFQEALRLKPDYTEAKKNLDRVLENRQLQVGPQP